MTASRPLQALISAALLVSASPWASAGTLLLTDDPLGYVTMTVNNKGVAETAYPMMLKSIFNDGSGPKTILNFCVDIDQSISFNTLYSDYSIAPTGSANGFNSTQAELLGKLFTAAGLIDNRIEGAAFQLASWEIMADWTSPNLSNGKFSVGAQAAGSDGASAVALANSWLTELPGITSQFNVTKLYSPTAQDQMFATAVPEPGSWALAGVALAAAFVGGRKRRAAASVRG